jgi:hypothetical protein
MRRRCSMPTYRVTFNQITPYEVEIEAEDEEEAECRIAYMKMMGTLEETDITDDDLLDIENIERCSMPRPKEIQTYSVWIQQIRYQHVEVQASSEPEAKAQVQDMIEARHPRSERYLKDTRWSNGTRWKYGPVIAAYADLKPKSSPPPASPPSDLEDSAMKSGTTPRH